MMLFIYNQMAIISIYNPSHVNESMVLMKKAILYKII